MVTAGKQVSTTSNVVYEITVPEAYCRSPLKLGWFLAWRIAQVLWWPLLKITIVMALLAMAIRCALGKGVADSAIRVLGGILIVLIVIPAAVIIEEFIHAAIRLMLGSFRNTQIQLIASFPRSRSFFRQPRIWLRFHGLTDPYHQLLVSLSGPSLTMMIGLLSGGLAIILFPAMCRYVLLITAAFLSCQIYALIPRQAPWASDGAQIRRLRRGLHLGPAAMVVAVAACARLLVRYLWQETGIRSCSQPRRDVRATAPASPRD